MKTSRTIFSSKDVKVLTICCNDFLNKDIKIIGNQAVLNYRKRGLLCLIKAPGQIILQASQWAKKLQDKRR